MRTRGARVVVLLFVGVAYLAGALAFLDNRLTDLFFEFADRDATGNAVVVAIDAKSIREIGVWPWPRRLHAKLISVLDGAGTSRAAFAIDFSSRSNEIDDGAFADAIAAAEMQVLLPQFRQAMSSTSAGSTVAVVQPLPRFKTVADVVAMDLRPAEDGKLRSVDAVDAWGGRYVPRISAALAARPVVGTFDLDFGIRPASIPVVSYVDVLNGRIAPDFFADKVVLVGSTAVELGNLLPVPLYGFLPGVLVEALAYESIVQGRPLQRLPLYVGLVGALIAFFTIASLLSRWRWHGGVALMVAAVSIVLLGDWALYVSAATILDAAPFLVAIVAAYLLAVFDEAGRLARALYAQRVSAEYNRALTSAVVQHSFDGILTVNPDGTVRNFNLAAEQIFGFDKEDVVGRDASVLFPFSRDGGYVGDVLGFLKGRAEFSGNEEPVETVGRRSDGQIFPMELSVVEPHLQFEKRGLRRQEDVASVLVCTVRDISRRKAAEDKVRRLNEELEVRVIERTRQLEEAQQELVEQERLATLGRLIATITHELRNPLGTIRNSVRYIRKWDVSGELQDVSERLDRNVVRCDRIITELLDYSRERPIVVEEVAIDTWLRQVIEEYAIPDDVALQWEIGVDHPAIAIDATRLSLAITNVVENACQAMQEIGEEVGSEKRLTVRRRTTDRQVVIEISDSGPGIPAPDLERIFEPFYSTKGFGVGLGLPLASSVVAQHGGAIEVSSEMGEGTTLTILLPIHRDDAVNAA